MKNEDIDKRLEEIEWLDYGQTGGYESNGVEKLIEDIQKNNVLYINKCKNCRNYNPNFKEDINSGYCTFLLIGMDKDDGCIKGFNAINSPTNPTDTKLAEFYNLTRQTIAKYRKSDTNLYRAMVMYYNSKTQPQQ